MKIKAYRVSRVVEYMKELLEEDIFLCSILIEGEISNFRRHSSGHLYFSLKDEAASLRCVIFKGDAGNLPFGPKDGDFVQIYGRVALYKKMGDVQFIGEFMENIGRGKIRDNLEAVKTKLHQEGIFDNDRSLPKYPEKIAIVTSPTGAAVFDMINTARRRNPLVQLILVPALVQGDDAPADIVRAIEVANENSGADILIVGRGGGSAEDLWAFNTEIVARAVHGSAIPVISAVGHEIDVTICDFAADLRAATPTAAAELATPRLDEMQAQLAYLADRMHEAMGDRLADCRAALDNRLYRLSPERQVSKISAQRSLLAAKLQLLEKVSPLSVLSRGFVLAKDADGNIVKSGADLISGQRIVVQFSDMAREAEII
ncbi:MAG: exodeoxyribonuclease VII large subunit [Clostridiales bacterium]|nr:exodeoxyribonuclease VII large subunit [Clostridiales bacterium]